MYGENLKTIDGINTSSLLTYLKRRKLIVEYISRTTRNISTKIYLFSKPYKIENLEIYVFV